MDSGNKRQAGATMQITGIHANTPEEAKGLIRLALTRGQTVQGSRHDLGRTNRDAFTIRIHGDACEAVISWVRDKGDDGRFNLSYARTWDADAKTWQPVDLNEIKSLLEGMEALSIDVQERADEPSIPTQQAKVRSGLRSTRDVHLPA